MGRGEVWYGPARHGEGSFNNKGTKKMKLTDIVRNTLYTLAEVEDAGGELSEEIEAQLDLLHGDLRAKTDAYVFLLRTLESQAEVFKSMAGEFMAKSKACSNRVEDLKLRLKQASNILGEKSLVGNYFEIRLVKANPTLVITENEVPPQFIRITQKSEIDRARIKEELREGAKISGCRLEETKAVRIFPTTKKGELK